MHVLCVVADVADCGVIYQTTYTKNCNYICYMKYLIQVAAECLPRLVLASETLTQCFYNGQLLHTHIVYFFVEGMFYF